MPGVRFEQPAGREVTAEKVVRESVAMGREGAIIGCERGRTLVRGEIGTRGGCVGGLAAERALGPRETKR